MGFAQNQNASLLGRQDVAPALPWLSKVQGLGMRWDVPPQGLQYTPHYNPYLGLLV